MKKNITILLFILSIASLYSQGHNTEENKIDFSSLENQLDTYNQSLEQIKGQLVEFDSLAYNGELSALDYFQATRLIIDNEVREGYNFVLKYAHLYTYFENRRLVASGNYISLTLFRALKSVKYDSKLKFLDYIIFSNYLNNNLSKDELATVSKLFSSGLNYFQEKELELIQNIEMLENLDN